jgi:hypothetical protein
VVSSVQTVVLCVQQPLFACALAAAAVTYLELGDLTG